MSTTDITALIERYRLLTREADDIAAEIESIKDSIKAEMVAQATETLTGPGWKATWANVRTTRLDSKALKAEEPELYARYSKSTTQTRFTIR